MTYLLAGEKHQIEAVVNNYSTIHSTNLNPIANYITGSMVTNNFDSRGGPQYSNSGTGTQNVESGTVNRISGSQNIGSGVQNTGPNTHGNAIVKSNSGIKIGITGCAAIATISTVGGFVLGVFVTIRYPIIASKLRGLVGPS